MTIKLGDIALAPNKYEAYVYRFTNSDNGKIYIGFHKGSTVDKYRHSSKSKEFSLNQTTSLWNEGGPAFSKFREKWIRRKVFVKKFEITKIKLPEIEFLIECGKGTYIRSIANDFGKSLNSGAHLKNLRRIATGNFKIKNAIKFNF